MKLSKGKKEKLGDYLFSAYIIVSVLTGALRHVISYFNIPTTFDVFGHEYHDYNIYYFGEQSSELILLSLLALGYKSFKKEIIAVICLSGAELIDEVFREGAEIKIFEIVLVAIVFIAIGSFFKKDKRRIE